MTTGDHPYFVGWCRDDTSRQVPGVCSLSKNATHDKEHDNPVASTKPATAASVTQTVADVTSAPDEYEGIPSPATQLWI